MQKVDAVKVSVGSMVLVNRNGVQIKARVLRAPTFKDGDFKPTQFKIYVKGGDWEGNHYVSYTAVHTAEADKAQNDRKVAAEIAKAQKAEAKAQKTAARIDRKASLKGLSADQLIKLASALKTLDELGYSVDMR